VSKLRCGQGNKVGAEYYDAARDAVRPEFRAMQRRFYRDPVPYRHQAEFLAKNPDLVPAKPAVPSAAAASAAAVPRDRGKREADAKARGANKNIPLFAQWVLADGTALRVSYVESRQFYCAAFEHLVLREPDWQRLVDMVAGGTNVCICGFDAQPVGDTTSEQRYLSPLRPFGHEDVIVAMLCDPPATWPWRLHRTHTFSVSHTPIAPPHAAAAPRATAAQSDSD
jgi:hypothetical protein